MKPRRRRLRLLLLALVAGAFAAVFGLPQLGRYLVVADELVPSDAIFVLEGGTPARELEAAALYRAGVAPRVVLTLARDPLEVPHRLAGEPNPQERAARVLAHIGVPAAAIVQLDRVVENTVQELAADFEYAQSRGFRAVVLVTSPPHTRRVRVIWNSRFESRMPARIRPTRYEEFDARRWWRSRRWLEDGLHELVGIAHFMIGSPLPTFDRGR